MPVSLGTPPGIALPPASGNALIDLTTSSHAAHVLLAGGVSLTPAQELILPSLITAGSREIIRYCGNRLFRLTTLTEMVVPEGGRQDRGEPATAKLSQFPVQQVLRVMTGRTPALVVANHDPATNQIAQLAFQTTGDVEWHDLTYTGLRLTRVASGATHEDLLTFADSPTLQALASAVNALGGGWSASVQLGGGAGGLGAFPAAELIGAREPKNARGCGARLDLFTTPASSFEIDRSTGILRCVEGACSAWGHWDGGLGDGGSLGRAQWSVTYQAGWATVPEDLQQVCAEVVKGVLARLDTDPTLESETADHYQWTARESLATLPPWAVSTLNSYKDWSA